VSILVNNVGFGRPYFAAEIPYEEIKSTLDVGLWPAMWFTKALAPKIVQHGKGCIVNVSSRASLVPIPGAAMYSSSKAFLSYFSSTLR
jgi:short-subunit dehydrogenase